MPSASFDAKIGMNAYGSIKTSRSSNIYSNAYANHRKLALMAYPQAHFSSCQIHQSLQKSSRTHMSTLLHASRNLARTTVHASGSSSSPREIITPLDLQLLSRAADLSLASQGETQPHPNAACILTDVHDNVIAEASLWAQGTTSPEQLAYQKSGSRSQGGTAYLNIETGDCHGEFAGVNALIHSGVARVIIGMRHPLTTHRNVAINELQKAGIRVLVLGESECSTNVTETLEEETIDIIATANEPLLHRAAFKRPMGILKYAMTLDGKIAASSGHASWVSSTESRQVVFQTRAQSDAVIVGGQTVRRDDPRLTTRRDSGHQPVRIVMSRTLDLPEGAALWDISTAPTIVATQKGARRNFQKMLRSRGVEVLEFDFLTPDEVSKYCYQRGFLSCLWECGGKLAAPAISGGAIHKVLSFVAPKIIGGTTAPTPVGDLGFVEMTQALDVEAAQWRQVGPDMLITGYLPRSGGPRALAAELGLYSQRNHRIKDGGRISTLGGTPSTKTDAASTQPSPTNTSMPWMKMKNAITFYKAWDHFGALSNFSPHSIAMPEGPMTHQTLEAFTPHSDYATHTAKIDAADKKEMYRVWPSTEHYYQAQKFAGIKHPDAEALIEQIARAESPEVAAAIGRSNEASRPELMRDDWNQSKIAAMHAALRAKFAAHSGPRSMLLGTLDAHNNNINDNNKNKNGDTAISSVAGSRTEEQGVAIVESSPHDYFWGGGVDGSGLNMLGRLLMEIRREIMDVSMTV